jgi:hypothetical protein
MKVKHTQNGNVKITLTLDEASLLNGALWKSRQAEVSHDSEVFSRALEELLDTANVGVEF